MFKSKIKIISIITVLFVQFDMANSQELNYSFDTIVNNNETIIINTNNYRGKLNWQNSYDGQNWNNINQSSDVLSFQADSIMVVRARVDEANCFNSWYSDTVLINFIPVISRIEPDSSVIGDTIKLFGSNFNVFSNTTIKFDDISANILSINDSVIEALLPFEINTPSFDVILKLYNTQDNSNMNLLPPVLYNTYPDTLSIGETVSIKGENFTYNSAYNYVTTGIDNSANVIFATRDSLRFVLPEGKYHSRNAPIKICVGGQCDSLENEIFIDDPWLQKGDAPSGQFGRYYATGFQISDTAFMGLGLGIGFDASKDFWKYDYKNDSWTKINDFPGGPRTHAISFVINDTAYVGGGYSNHSGTKTKDFWRYNNSSDQWVQVTDIPRINNAGICSFSIEDKGYIITREADSNFWAYSPSANEWELMPNFIPNDSYIGYADIACVINNKAYVLTNNGTTGVDEVWEFTPNTNTWTRKADQIADNLFYNGRSLFVLNNEAYLFPDAYHNVFSKYNPIDDEWTILTQAKPGGRNYGVVFVFNDIAYFGTGTYFSDAYSDFWEFNPSLFK